MGTVLSRYASTIYHVFEAYVNAALGSVALVQSAVLSSSTLQKILGVINMVPFTSYFTKSITASNYVEAPKKEEEKAEETPKE